MALYFQRPDSSYVYFDLTDEEQHEYTSEITDYPVEDGPDIADHARGQLRKFTITATVSNTPISDAVLVSRGASAKTIEIKVDKYKAPASFTPGFVTGAIEDAVSNLITGGDPTSYNANFIAFDSPFDAAAEIQATLADIVDKSELLNVFTSKAYYEGVMLEKGVVTRNAGTGTGSSVTMAFRVIQIVQTAVGAAPASTEPRGQAPVNKGAKGQKPAADSDKESIANAGFDGIISAIKKAGGG